MSLFRWLAQFVAGRNRSRRRHEAQRWHDRLQTQPAASPLEPRRLLNAAPVVPPAPPAPPADVIINAGQFANDGQADTFVISQHASGKTVTVNGQFQQVVETGQRLVIQGSADTDHVLVDFGQGGPSSGHIQFQGHGGIDFLQLEGAGQSVTHVFHQDGSSTIQVDESSLTYAGDVAVTDQLQATERAFDFDGDQLVSIADVSADDGVQSVEGQYGQSVQFAATSAVLTFDSTNDTAQQIRVDGLDARFHGDLIIQGDAQDQVRLSGYISLGAGDLIVKAGTVTVDGQIETTSADVRLDATLRLSIEAGGQIVNSGGTIVADAGMTGTLTVSGVLDVSHLQPGQQGGAIQLLGNDVQLKGANIQARGDAGGAILVGGDYQGKNPDIRNASRTIVDRLSVLDASAVATGNGGKVIVWADHIAAFAGKISVTGGAVAGNGGFVETSGKAYLLATGKVDASARHGDAGTWLLDPYDITISNAATAGGAFDGNLVTNEFTPAATANVSVADIESLVDGLNNGTNILITTSGAGLDAGDITVQNNISKTAGGNATLTLVADNDITINSGVAITSTSNKLNVELNAANNIVASGSTITTNDGDVTATATSGAITLGNMTTGSGNLNATAAGAITDAAATTLSIGGIATLSGASITLGDNAGDTTNFGSLEFDSAGAVAITEDSAVVVSGASTAGGLTLIGNDAGVPSDGDVTLNATVNVTGATSITASGRVHVNAKLTGTTTIQLDAGDDILIDAAVDPTTVTMTADDDITINAAVAADDLITVSAGQGATNTGSVVIGATGSLTTTNPGSDISVNTGTAAGSITLTGTTTAVDTVTMTSTAGSISGAGLITAAKVSLDAGTNLGSVGTRLQTSADNLEARAANGGIFITEANGITVGGASGLTGLSTTGGNGAIDLQSTAGAITVSEAVSANGSGNVTLNAAGLLTVNQKVSSTTGNLSLTGGTGVTHNATGDLETGGAGTISVTATTGSINMADGTLYDAGAGAVTLLANTNVALGKIDTTGPINVTATTGAITDATAGEGAGNENLAGSTVTLTAATGVGTSSAAGDIDTAATTLIATTGTGGIFLTETNGVAVGPLATTTSGDIVVTAGNSMTTAGAVTTAGNGNIHLSTTTGNITLSHNVSANGSGNVTLNAAGSLAQTANTILGNILRFISGGAIGANANKIQTSANRIAASATGGGIFIVDAKTTGVMIGANDAGADGLAGLTAAGEIYFEENSGVAGGGITVQEAVSTSAAGGITIRAHSPLVVNADVTDNAGGNILLAAEGQTVADDLTINANVTATGGNGNIQLFAGDAITMTAGRIISAANSGAVTVRAGTDYNGGAIQDGVSNVDSPITMAATAEIRSEDGNITLRAPGNIAVAVLNANSDNDAVLGMVVVTADDAGQSNTQSNNVGAITDANAGTLNVTANGLALSAATGIAAAADRMETNVATLAAKSTTSNGIYLEEVAAGGNLTIGTVNGVVGLDSSTAASGDISIRVNNGTLDVNNQIKAGNDIVRLRASGDITQSAAITASQLAAVSTTGHVSLDTAANDVTTFAATATTADKSVAYRDATAVDVGQVLDDAGGVLGGTVTGITVHAASGIVRLQATNDITQSQAILGQSLGAVSTTGSVQLSSPNNNVSIFAARAAAANQQVNFQNAVGFSVGSVTSILNPAGTNNALVFTDKRAPTNRTGAITIVYQDPGAANQALSLQILPANGLGDTTILVSLATDATGAVTTTAAQVEALINGDAIASTLLDAANAAGNNGTGVVTASSQLGPVSGITAAQASGTVRLKALTGDITQAGTTALNDWSPIIANRLGAVATTGSVDLSLADNRVNTLAAQATAPGEEVNFQNAIGFDVGQVTAGGPFGAAVQGIQADADSGTVRLQSRTGNVTQTFAIVADALGVEAAAVDGNNSSIDLNLPTNNVNSFAAEAQTSIHFQTAGDLDIGTVTKGGGPMADRLFYDVTNPPVSKDLVGVTVRNGGAGDDTCLTAQGNLTQSAAIVTNALGAVSLTGRVDLSLSTNDVDTFSAEALTDVNFQDADGFDVGATDCAIGITAGDTVRLQARDQDITQSYGIVADELGAMANNGKVDLSLFTADPQQQNDVDTFAAQAATEVNFHDLDGFDVGAVAAGGTAKNSVVPRMFDEDLSSITNGQTVSGIRGFAGNSLETVRLQARSGDITQTYGIVADELGAMANAGSVDLSQYTADPLQQNDVNQFSAQAAVEVNFQDTDGFDVEQVLAGGGPDPVNDPRMFDHDLNPATDGQAVSGIRGFAGNPLDTIRLQARSGDITQTYGVVANELGAMANAGSVDLSQFSADPLQQNDVNQFAAQATDDVNFQDVDGFDVEQVLAGGGPDPANDPRMFDHDLNLGTDGEAISGIRGFAANELDTVRLQARSGDITQTFGIVANELGAMANAGSVDLSQYAADPLQHNDVNQFAAQATNEVNFHDLDEFDIEQVLAGGGPDPVNAPRMFDQDLNPVTDGQAVSGIRGFTGNVLDTVRLQARSGDITQSYGVAAIELGAMANNGKVDLSLHNALDAAQQNDVNEFAAQATDEVNFQDIDEFDVEQVLAGGGPDPVNDPRMFDHDLNPATDGQAVAGIRGFAGNPLETVRLQARSGDITQTYGIVADELGAMANQGSVDLSQYTVDPLQQNDVNQFAAQAVDEVNFQDLDDFDVEEVLAGGGPDPLNNPRMFDNDLANAANPGVDLTGIQAGGDTQTSIVRLQARTGDITQTEKILAVQLGAMANTGSVDLSLASNDADTFAAQAVDQVNFQDADGFSVGTVLQGGSSPARMFDDYSNANPQVIDLIGIKGVGNTPATTVRLQALTGDITQSDVGAILATQLGVEAKAGDIHLCDAPNDVDTFAAKSDPVTGSVSFRDADTFLIGSVTAGGGPDPVNNPRLFDTFPGVALTNITAPDSINLVAGGDLNVNVPLTSATIRLKSETDSVTQGAGDILTADDLAVQANTFVNLTENNVVDRFAADAGDYVYFKNTQALAVDFIPGDDCIDDTDGVQANNRAAHDSATANVEILVTSGDLSINRPVIIHDNPANSQETVRLWTQNGSISQAAAGPIAADRLSVRADGNDMAIDLSLAINDVREFAATAEKNITFLNQGALEIEQILAGPVVTQDVDGVTSTDNGTIKVITRNETPGDGDLTVSRPVNTTATIYLTAEDSVALAANVGNANTDAVTITALNGSITRTAGIVTATAVNLNGDDAVGAGTIADTVDDQQGIDDWNALLNGNPNGVNVQASTLTVSGGATGNPLDPAQNPAPILNDPVAGDVFLDVSPLTANGTITIQSFIAGNDVVITSDAALPDGTVQLNGIATGNHILVQTDVDNIVIGGNLTSAANGVNTIAVQAGGNLTKPDDNVAITTGNMRLLQLIENAIHENPDGSPFNASNNDQLQNNIYADYQSFQVVAPFLSPNEALIRPNENNSIIATYGTNTEFGWNIGIDWGDGTPPSSLPPEQPRPAGSIAQDAATPLEISHFYEQTADATYDVNLTVSVDPSISLRSEGGTVRYESQTLRTNIQVSSIVPPPAFFLRPEPPPATPVIVTSQPVLVAAQPLQVVPEELKTADEALVAPKQVIYLELYQIPEDGTDPRIVTAANVKGIDEETGQIDLDLLSDGRLLDFIKSQPDGRYRLVLIRAIRTPGAVEDEVFDERTVLETVIKDHVPTNPIEDTIERLQRQLKSGGESSDQDDTDAKGAHLALPPSPSDLTPETAADAEMAHTPAAALGLTFFGRLFSRFRKSPPTQVSSPLQSGKSRKAG